ncbi:MAG TPA: hypothetical protein PKG67_01485, partial [Turneriella sp.]|nr:hypothetical protein [Turneriella sp.]
MNSRSLLYLLALILAYSVAPLAAQQKRAKKPTAAKPQPASQKPEKPAATRVEVAEEDAADAKSAAEAETK